MPNAAAGARLQFISLFVPQPLQLQRAAVPVHPLPADGYELAGAAAAVSSPEPPRGGLPELEAGEELLAAVLAAASDGELEELTEILYRPKIDLRRAARALGLIEEEEVLEGPVFVERLMGGAPGSRAVWEAKLAGRLRECAATAAEVLGGRAAEVTYGRLLRRVCRRLALPLRSVEPAAPEGSRQLAPPELELQVYMYVLREARDRMSPGERAQFDSFAAEGDEEEALRTLLKGGGAVALSVLGPLAVQQAARTLAARLVALQARPASPPPNSRPKCGAGGAPGGGERGGGGGCGARGGGRGGAGAARAGARLAFTRGLLGFLGPAMWAWFLADLGARALDVDVARLVPAVALLTQAPPPAQPRSAPTHPAQIRLLKLPPADHTDPAPPHPTPDIDADARPVD
eukprot:tig00001376_g8523.t1